MKKLLACFFFSWLVCNSQLLIAYDVETHRELAQRATDPEVSSLDQTLNHDLNLPKGVEEEFLGREVRLWIGEGAVSEDSPLWRVLNHFHNPITSQWENAGLNAFGGRTGGQSSVLWQQNNSQNTSIVFVPNPLFLAGSPIPLPTLGGNRSWHDTRQEYLTALTGENKTEREIAFAHVFRNLGHLTHLVQDATVPAHVRNDPHPPGNSDWYEGWAEKNPNTVNQFINLPAVRPEDKVFPPTMHNLAPVPIAGLIDTNLFNGTNFTALSDPNIGVSEYTNGNFLSRNTIFEDKDFTLPRPFSLDLNNFILEPVGMKWRRYFRKVGEGELVDHFVTEGMLFESLLAARGGTPPPAGGWTMDDRVQEDYGRLLLPRAVGYSAGLLDYFFRGKLDVELLEDPVDPSIVHLEGVNASPDKLDGGTLTLYADDPNGIRSPLVVLDPTDIIVDPDQPLSSARFQAPEDAERFIAVYKGTLGNEVPNGDFPGGVIGKVLGGVRVEQLFKDSTRWYLRTPQGVFPLPILTQEIEDLRWGDQDNTLVGRSRIGPGQPNLFYAFEIKRVEGSLEPVLVPDPSSGTEVVDLLRSDPVGFPLDIGVGTTVHLSHTIEFKQQTITAFRVETKTWNPNSQRYDLTNVQYVDPQLRLLADDEQTLNRSFAVTLGLDSFGGRLGPLYAWHIQDIALNSQGKILALAAVRPNFTLEGVEFDVYGITTPISGNGNDDLRTFLSPNGPAFYSLTFPFNMGQILSALVNVSDGQIVSNSALSDVTLSHRTAQLLSSISSRVFKKEMHVGGPQDGVFIYAPGGEVGFVGNCTTQPIMAFSAPIIQQSGNLHATVNQYRPEIAQHQPAVTPVQQETTTRHFITCGAPQFGAPPMAVDILTRGSGYNTTRMDAAARIKPGSGPESMVFIMDLHDAPNSVPRTTRGKLLHWTPERNEAPSRQEFFEPELMGRHSIRSVARGAALISSTFNPAIFTPATCGSSCFSASTLVPLEEGSVSVELQGINLADFVLLDPKFLYNVTDLKFYTKQDFPQRTALPAILAIGGIVSLNDYHFHTVTAP